MAIVYWMRSLVPMLKKSLIDSLFTYKRIIFRSANGVGKTSVVLVAAILYGLEMLNAQIISTSATYRQVASQLIPCLKSYAHLYPKWEFLENAIVIDGIKRYIGFSTDNEAAFQGYHEFPGRPLVILVDEAAGVPESIFRAIDRCRPTYYLITGSPLSPEGEFYLLETKPDVYDYFKHFKMTAPECPWIKKQDIDIMIAKWGKEHPLVLSSIYADFSNESDNAIISLTSLNKCLNYPPPYMAGARRVAIDFAAGGDENIICYRNGNLVKFIKCWRDKDTMQAAGEIVNALNELKLTTGLSPSEVYGDASGLGKPILDRLAEQGWRVNYFFGQAKPSCDDYRNLISECWLELAKQIVNCTIILPNDSELKGQLLSRKQRLNSSGKLELESKEDMRDRGIPSPDRADAVAMACGPVQGGIISWIEPFKSKVYANSTCRFI